MYSLPVERCFIQRWQASSCIMSPVCKQSLDCISHLFSESSSVYSILLGPACCCLGCLHRVAFNTVYINRCCKIVFMHQSNISHMCSFYNTILLCLLPFLAQCSLPINISLLEPFFISHNESRMGSVNAAKHSLQCNMVFSIFVCSEMKSDVNQFRSLKAT